MKDILCPKCRGAGKIAVAETEIDRQLKALYAKTDRANSALLVKRGGCGPPKTGGVYVVCGDGRLAVALYSDCEELAQLNCKVMDLRLRQEKKLSHGIRYCSGGPHRIVPQGDVVREAP